MKAEHIAVVVLILFFISTVGFNFYSLHVRQQMHYDDLRFQQEQLDRSYNEFKILADQIDQTLKELDNRR